MYMSIHTYIYTPEVVSYTGGGPEREQKNKTELVSYTGGGPEREQHSGCRENEAF